MSKKMNILSIEKDCAGCAGCADICPANAIKMIFDKDGFLIPGVDNLKCTNCGKCVKICPVINKSEIKPKIAFYYGWSKPEEIRALSSSGGLFSVLADKILHSGGVVFGAAYMPGFSGAQIKSTQEVTLEDLRRSKYVQSNAEGAYRLISKYIDQGKSVLLAGTPCQIAAARNIFGYNKKNLILIDFFCGGVTPQPAFDNYIKWLEKKHKSTVASVNFRDKSKGWSRMNIRVDFKNGKKYRSYYEYDPYYYYFYTPYLKNTQCLRCSFISHNDADITLGDFWGYRKAQIPSDDKGMSIIIINTEAGQALFNSILDKLSVSKLSCEQVAYGFQPKRGLTQVEKEKRAKFLSEVKKTSFMDTAKRYYYKGGKAGIAIRKIIRKIKRLFKENI